MALGCSKIVFCNYLKSPNKYGTRKSTCGPEKLSPQFKRKNVREVKIENFNIKILKSLVDASCSTRKFWRYLNNKKIKHKRNHRPRLTMKHKEKRLEYARQYQTMSAKEWRKVVFSDKKDAYPNFQSYQSLQWIYKILNKKIAFIFYSSAHLSYIYVKTKFQN